MTTLVVDDLRSFMDGRDAAYARTSAEGIEALETANSLQQLWLDHDLGWCDTIRPVVLWLIDRAESGNPFPVDTIYVHTANPAAAESMLQQLSKHYAVFRRSASSEGLYADF
jgi:hypothetical protein